jgi:hypothetical protein
MKSFLIVILSLALTTAAFFTRPTEADFREFVADRVPKDRRSLAEKLLRFPSPADQATKEMVFKDRYLWVQVEDKTGKVLYTGAFSYWLERGGNLPERRQPKAGKTGQDAQARGKGKGNAAPTVTARAE